MTKRLQPTMILIGIVITSLLVGHVTPAQGTDVNPSDGKVTGIWKIGDSPFHVKRDIVVPSDSSLTIEPGVNVYFDGYWNFTVRGKLVAVGTQGNNITFVSNAGGTSPSQWVGICLLSSSMVSTISYCKILNARIAIASYGSFNNVLSFNTMRYSWAGILINAAEGNSIIHNEIYDNTNYAICLQQGSNRNDISQNQIYRIGAAIPVLRGEGVVVNGSLSSSMNTDNKIRDNTVHDCYLSAIRLDHTQTLEISGNTIYNNYQGAGPTNGTGGGMYLRKSNDPSLDYENKDITIYNNRIHSAGYNGTGIYIQSARNVRITYNDIYLNGFAGIIASDNPVDLTTLCQINRNSIRNNHGARQAWDDGTSNLWDDGTRGNYWSDYRGVDSNNDGIGDTPYTVPGHKSSKDNFPLQSVSLVMVTTVATTTTRTGTLNAYTSTTGTTTTTTTTYTSWTTTVTTLPVTNTSVIFTSKVTSTATVNTTTVYQTYTLSVFTFFATSTSYIWTVSASTTSTIWSTSSTSTTTTVTTTSTSVSTSFSTTSTTTTTTVTATQASTTPRRCIIASAAYDSDLEPHVQFLRDFRDQRVMRSFIGSQFMNAFNTFYYSFSPTVAEGISTSDYARAVTRGLLSPLLGSLYIGQVAFDLLSVHPDFDIVLAGMLSTALIGILYGSPLIALNVVKAEEKKKRSGWSLKPLGLVWIGSLLAVGLSYVFLYIGAMAIAEFVAMVSTGTLVLSTMILSPLLLLRFIRWVVVRVRRPQEPGMPASTA